MSAERDYAQQKVVQLLEQVSSLQKEMGFLSRELQERKEDEEFKALEEACHQEKVRNHQSLYLKHYSYVTQHNHMYV